MLAACGGGGGKTYAAEPTQNCLSNLGHAGNHQLDVIAAQASAMYLGIPKLRPDDDYLRSPLAYAALARPGSSKGSTALNSGT
jgi:hypothetical protein